MKELIPYIFFFLAVILFISIVYFDIKRHKKFIKECDKNWEKFIKEFLEILSDKN